MHSASALERFGRVLCAPVYQPVVGFTRPQANPFSGLLSDGAGNFWGTTYNGGASAGGTVFKVNSTTGVLTTVIEFDDNTNKGKQPIGGLVSDGAGNFWGTTWLGGANNDGTVFKINVSTGVLTTVVEFTGNGAANKGAGPTAGLVSDGMGNLWSVTNFGGASNDGTVFKINITTGVLTTVAVFDNNITKGKSPFGALVDDGAGTCWGTTEVGGANGSGTVFKINANTGMLITVVQFTGTNGTLPDAPLVSDGAGSRVNLEYRSIVAQAATERGTPEIASSVV